MWPLCCYSYAGTTGNKCFPFPVQRLIGNYVDKGTAHTDAEVLRLHYALTIARWNDGVQKHRREIEARYGRAFFRAWTLCLCSCEIGMRYGDRLFGKSNTRGELTTTSHRLESVFTMNSFLKGSLFLRKLRRRSDLFDKGLNKLGT